MLKKKKNCTRHMRHGLGIVMIWELGNEWHQVGFIGRKGYVVKVN